MTDVPAERWDGLTAGEVAARCGIPAAHLFATVGSTNDVARALAEGGAPSGTAVLAEEQTAGRGRGGKGWASAPGLGIWLSLVIRPTALPSPGLLPVLVGLAAADELDRWAGAGAAQVKWPNDLYLGGRKAGGILCEGIWSAGSASAVIVGLGLNVLHTPEDFPPEVRDTATSLAIAFGAPPSRADVAESLIRAVVRAVSSPPARLSGALLDRLRARDYLLGRPVTVTGAEETAGIAMGITPEGRLLLRTVDGVLRAVESGTVRPTGPAVAAD
ncbi:MAG: biotin-(acetyl-CoA carboxylase) ligase [Gemmatimonadetes bacterium]|nr:biotin-(acetyl-CoA carboxylase) ligase [Gemmatimonadota bacterium]